MSREYVDLVRGAWTALERGDIETALERFAPDAVVDLTGGGRMDAGVHGGLEAIRTAWETWAGPWESMNMEATEFIDLDDEQLIVVFEATGRSRQTGLDFNLVRYWLSTLRDGLVNRVREFETRQEAFLIAGRGE